jgi:hypothetical protein
MRVKLVLTLANGDTHIFTRAKSPKHYKSWLMRQVPYGVNFQGASFYREFIEA